MPQLSTKESKTEIFEGRQIGQLIKDAAFLNSMNEAQIIAWTSFVALVGNFLGKRKAVNYVEVLNEMLDIFKSLRCIMQIKVRYLHSHIDRFPENLGYNSKEQGERIHQDIKTSEDNLKGRCDTYMIVDNQFKNGLFQNTFIKVTEKKFPKCLVTS